MAEEAAAAEGVEDGGAVEEPPVKCPDCVPGLPAWMATFSDLVTLLLTFFVLLLSFAKTESAKYEAALGSIRNAFGGNVLKQGEVIQRGKSPDDSPSMLDSQQPIKPFPIEFLTMEGILDKHEINRESDEDLKSMKENLAQYDLSENVDVYEMPEGVKVAVKDKIFFENGSIKPKKIPIAVYDKLVKMLSHEAWSVFIQGYSSASEKSPNGKMDAFQLSSRRAEVVMKSLISRGVKPEQISAVFYGDTRLDEISGQDNTSAAFNQKVEFILRKRDLNKKGHKVAPK